MDPLKEEAIRHLKTILEERAERAVLSAQEKEALWQLLILFQDYPFQTTKGLEFSYRLKGNEIFISRKEKSVTKSSVMIAFQTALMLGGDVSGPKKLGCFGASYLYPIFIEFGIIYSG